MYSLNWPNMFTASNTLLLQDRDAAINNLKLVLGSEKLGLFGDPRFGSNLKRFMFEENSTWLHDMVRDELYTTIRIYIPQIVVKRNDIKIKSNKHKMYAEVACRWFNDSKLDMFSIDLTED